LESLSYHTNGRRKQDSNLVDRIKSELKNDIYVETHIIKWYTKCGKPEKYLEIWNEIYQKEYNQLLLHRFVFYLLVLLGDIKIGSRITLSNHIERYQV